MARTVEALQTDIDRIETMIVKARKANNQDTLDVLEQALARLEGKRERLNQDSRAIRRASIDSATTELVAFENEGRVSRELKAEIQNSRGDLVRRRESA